MIGTRFHRLVVLEEVEPIRYSRTSVRRYRCGCDCGAELIAQRPNLLRGATKSCGCWKVESAGRHAIKHNMSQSPEYKIWAGIRKRCYNSNYAEFHLYGGRGIGMSDRWRTDFGAFLSDMGQRPTPSHSVERIDNGKGYEAANCRWATPIEQGHNTRKARIVSHLGREMTIRRFAAEIGHSYWSVYTWIGRQGLTVEDVLAKLSVASEETKLNKGRRRAA